MVSLHQVYGTRSASNPHARNWAQQPLLPARFGPRKVRQKMRSVLRKGVPSSA